MIKGQGLILTAIILGIIIILISTSLLIVFSSLRRIINKIKYKRLDKYREYFRKRIAKIIELDRNFLIFKNSFSPNSLKWRAFEEVLLEYIEEAEYREKIREILSVFGYPAYYEKLLSSKKVHQKVLAIDRLGRFSETKTIEKILNLLVDENNEISTASIIALSRIGSPEALSGILKRLAEILEKNSVSTKVVVAALSFFGEGGSRMLINYAKNISNPKILSVIMKSLANIGSEQALDIALKNLEHEEPEIRVKALKILASITDLDINEKETEKIIKLFSDPVWFVRLYAIKLIQKLKKLEFINQLGLLLFDEKWQVRSAAATALASFGDYSLDVFLNALRHDDRYVRETIFEEIEKSGYTKKLIDNIIKGELLRYVFAKQEFRYINKFIENNLKEDYEKSQKSEAIIKIMNEIAFSTSF